MQENSLKQCRKCLLPETVQNITFDTNGVCSHCTDYHSFVPLDEKLLIADINKIKKQRKGKFDVIVPISGGKDSTYMLYLAKKKYDLNVLAYTFDNGFMSSSALRNIRSAVDKTGVDYIFYKMGWDKMKVLYRAMLMNDGELCAPCGLGIQSGYLKIAKDFDVPLVMLGSSPLEKKSPPPENIYDPKRCAAILRKAQINDLSIIPTKHKVKVVTPMSYNRLSDEEIKQILIKEMDWEDQPKHSDCIAEPFSNYIRQKRYGHSRWVFFYSEMIRRGELTREEAVKRLADDGPNKEPANLELILDKLELTREDLRQILNVLPFQNEKYCTSPPKISKLKPRRIARFVLRKLKSTTRRTG